MSSFNEENISLTHIIKRIKESDLIPSLEILKSCIDTYMKAFEKALLKNRGIQEKELSDLENLSSLMNVRWISPNFGRLIHELGYTPQSLSSTDAGKLTQEIDSYNKEKGYYKGKVGERDVRRLIFEARFAL